MHNQLPQKYCDRQEHHQPDAVDSDHPWSATLEGMTPIQHHAGRRQHPDTETGPNGEREEEHTGESVQVEPDPGRDLLRE